MGELDRDAKTIDIVPTIADVLGAQIPWHVDGRSLRARPIKREVAVSTTNRDPLDADPNVVRAGVLATARRVAVGAPTAAAAQHERPLRGWWGGPGARDGVSSRAAR